MLDYTSLELTHVFKATAVLVGIGQVLAGAEMSYLHARGHLEKYLPYRIVRLHRRYLPSSFTHHRRYLFLAAVVRIIAGLSLAVAEPFTAGFTLAAAVLLLTVLVDGYRNILGGEGSDQMFLILITCLVLTGNGFTDSCGQQIGLLFIAAQAVLAYTTSGVAKALSHEWRTGRAIPGILATVGHGYPPIGAVFLRSRAIAIASSWFVIIYESAFLLALTGPVPAMIAISLGIVLHLSIAAVMGLNLFTFAFLATYPSIYWLSWVLRNEHLALPCFSGGGP